MTGSGLGPRRIPASCSPGVAGEAYGGYILCIYLHFLIWTGSEVRTHVSKWGNSLAVRIPKAFTADAGLEAGDQVEITLEGGRIVITPVGREYRLGELVDGITADNRPAETDWGPPVGDEVW